MRVTQSMLSANMLRNLNNSYTKMGKYQNQLDSGSVISRASEDPVVAVKNIAHKHTLMKNEQFKRNLDTADKWVDATDTAFDQLGSSIHRVKELVVNLASDTMTHEDRQKATKELEQIQAHMMDIGNTKIEGQYLFSGTNTESPLFVEDGVTATGNKKWKINPDVANGIDEKIKIEVYDGIEIPVNSLSKDMFQKVNDAMQEIVDTIKTDGVTGQEIGDLLTKVDDEKNPDSMLGALLVERANTGAMQNRSEIMRNRLELEEVSITRRLSKNIDTDYSKTITEMVTQEAIHQASLSVGARIIQPTLVDFMR